MCELTAKFLFPGSEKIAESHTMTFPWRIQNFPGLFDEDILTLLAFDMLLIT